MACFSMDIGQSLLLLLPITIGFSKDLNRETSQVWSQCIVGHPWWCRLNLNNAPDLLLSSHKVSQFLFFSIPHEVYPPKSLLVGKSWQTKKKISEIKLDNKFCSMKLCKWIFCKRGSSQHWRSSTTGRSNLHNAPELLLLLPKKHNDS